MGNFLQSWRESLELFLPNNLSKFLLVTLKTLYEGCFVIFKYFWWLIVLQIILNLGSIPTYNVISFGIQLLLYFCIIAAMRPSVDQKNLFYFLSRIIYYFLFYIVAKILFLLVSTPLHEFWIADRAVDLLLIFYMLFLLDQRLTFGGIITALIRAIKMVLYNLPACCIFFGLMGLLYSLLFTVLNVQQPMIALIFLHTIFVAIVTNFYIKRVHEQFKVYYETP